MKATIHAQYGSPRVLRIEEVAKPTLADDQILIEVHASIVTQGDRRLRAADYPGATAIIGRLMFGLLRPRNPTPGTNFAGKVVEIGKAVTRFQIGDEVFGGCMNSAQAEYLAVAVDSPIAKIPSGVDFDDAAAVPYGGATALAFMRDVAAVKPGDRVLIIGASGGVGRFAVQIARHLGGKVTGVCSAAKAKMVRELGAHRTIDYAREVYTQDGETYDVIFDTISGDGFREAKPSLSPRGRYVTLHMTMRVMFQMLTSAIFGGPRAAASVVLGDQQLTEDVAALLAEGAIWPVIAARFPLAQVVDAHHALESPNTMGTVVVSVVQDASDAADGAGRSFVEGLAGR
ncbi:MAG: NAD(P)-dependent alcohol dehydrogenase [Nannocystaceae bacterium]